MRKLEKIVILAVIVVAVFFVLTDNAKGTNGFTATASWYGPGLYGNHLACGGTMSPDSWGVANRTLPCGTKLTVCLRRCAAVTVIDRGPYVNGREFDLTAAVASYIGFQGVRSIEWWRR